MNDGKERDFASLAAESGQFQEIEEIRKDNYGLWRENRNLYRAIQELQIAVLQAENDTDIAYMFAQLLITELPKGTRRKRAQRILKSLEQRQQRWFPESMYIQMDRYDNPSHHGVYGGYDECGGYGYEDYRQKERRVRRRRSLSRR